MIFRTLTIAFLACLIAFGAHAGETIPGPVTATVVSVYDGDTITVDAHPWLGMTIRTRVRLAGIDTPEHRGKCEEEKALAIAARDRLAELVGDLVQLYDIEQGKWGGRIVADVWVGDMRPASVLVAEGHARVWTGKRESWCPAE